MDASAEIPKWKLIDTKMKMRIGRIGELIRRERFTKNDIGKFFVMTKDEQSGRVMTYDEMFALDLDEIGGWYKIDELDVD